MKRTAIF